MKIQNDIANDGNTRIIVPGDIIGSIDHYHAGIGTYIRGDNIHASIVGSVVIEKHQNGDSSNGIVIKENDSIHIISLKGYIATESVLNITDEVICRVTGISLYQVSVSILYVRDRELKKRANGVIRKEDIRSTEIDKVIIHECFRAGDIIKARILSYGDARQYYLSTSEDNLGVIYAKSQSSKHKLMKMIDDNYSEMIDEETKTIEKRKVAKI